MICRCPQDEAHSFKKHKSTATTNLTQLMLLWEKNIFQIYYSKLLRVVRVSTLSVTERQTSQSCTANNKLWFLSCGLILLLPSGGRCPNRFHFSSIFLTLRLSSQSDHASFLTLKSSENQTVGSESNGGRHFKVYTCLLYTWSFNKITFLEGWKKSKRLFVFTNGYIINHKENLRFSDVFF